jgi:hypothetical protein
MVSAGGAVAEVVEDGGQSKERDHNVGELPIRARELALGSLTQVLMVVRPLVPGGRDSALLAHVLLHVLGDCARHQFGPGNPFVMRLGAFVNDNASNERLKGEVIPESPISVS